METRDVITTKTMYIGHCPECGREQESTLEILVNVKCNQCMKRDVRIQAIDRCNRFIGAVVEDVVLDAMNRIALVKIKTVNGDVADVLPNFDILDDLPTIEIVRRR